jgi:hypothetical protein
MKKKYDPFTHKYKIGDLIVYKAQLLYHKDEVGMVTDIIFLPHDDCPIYEIDVPSGRDILTQFDAQFLLIPLEHYRELKKNRKKLEENKQKLIDTKEECVTLEEEDADR